MVLHRNPAGLQWRATEVGAPQLSNDSHAELGTSVMAAWAPVVRRLSQGGRYETRNVQAVTVQPAPATDQHATGRHRYCGAATTPVLQLEGVHKQYRRGDEQVQVLVDVDLRVDAGEFVVVTGPSGSGKSTLLHVAGGLDAPDAGTVSVAESDVWAMSARLRAGFRRRNLGFVFQFFNLVPMLTAVENVSLPLVLDGVAARLADARAAELLERVGLGGRARHRPAELSGGQLQRVAVARALAAGPSIILADEPTGNLDRHSSTEILELLRSLCVDEGAAIVMVTHDQAASRYGTREIHLVDGHARAVDVARIEGR